MKIQILTSTVSNATSKAGKPYQQLEVNFKNLTFGKVESKKLMPFGDNKTAFDALNGAKQGDVYEITVQKNAAGYNDWIGVKPATADSPSAAPTTSASAVTVKSNYETPDERAKKQIYIIRQSSLSSAVNNLSVGAKSPPASDAVLQLADVFFQWVLQDPEKAAALDLASMPNDFPNVE